MGPPNPILSPDGAYFWDGQAWRPMPPPVTTAPAPPLPAQVDRPSWLPAEQPLPGAPAAVAPPPPEQYVPPYPQPAPLWAPPAPASNGSRMMVMAAAGVILLLLLGIAGYRVVETSQANNTGLTSTAQLSSPSPTASASVSSQPAAALPLTADLQGEYCPVYTTPGCELDAAHGQMVCGSVSAGGNVEVYLSGDTSQRGTFHYAVKFADVSSGTPVYIDQNPDGTHRVVSWYETIG